jgi:hypothetical protein
VFGSISIHQWGYDAMWGIYLIFEEKIRFGFLKKIIIIEEESFLGL